MTVVNSESACVCQHSMEASHGMLWLFHKYIHDWLRFEFYAHRWLRGALDILITSQGAHALTILSVVSNTIKLHGYGSSWLNLYASHVQRCARFASIITLTIVQCL